MDKNSTLTEEERAAEVRNEKAIRDKARVRIYLNKGLDKILLKIKEVKKDGKGDGNHKKD